MSTFFIRLLLVIAGFVVIICAANSLYPDLKHEYENNLTGRLAAGLLPKIAQSSASPAENEKLNQLSRGKKQKKGKTAGQTKGEKAPAQAPLLPRNILPVILQNMAEQHICWCYLTDTRGKLIELTRTFAPDLPVYDETSRQLDWQAQSYYESVVPLGQGYAYNLHAGFCNNQPVGLTSDLFQAEIPQAIAITLLVFLVGGITLLYVFSIKLPLKKLLASFQQAKNGAGLDATPVLLPGAPPEIIDLRNLLEEKNKVLTERDEKIKEHDNTVRNLNSRFEQELARAKKEKNILYLKEAENQFVTKLSSSLEPITTVASISESVLLHLQTEFPTSFEYALFFSINKKQEAQLISHIGFQKNPLEVYKGLGLMKGLAESIADTTATIEPDDLVEQQFREICQLTGAHCVLMSPVQYQERRLALIITFFRGPEKSQEHLTRILNRVAHTCAKALHHIVSYEEQVEATRTDSLTGFPNKAYLPHLLPQLLSGADSSAAEPLPFSLFLVEGNDLVSLNEKYGQTIADNVIKELGSRIDKLLQQRRTETMGSWGDYLIRYQGAQFLVILRHVDTKRSTIFAQRLRQVVESEDYPSGVGKWPVSIGITSFPEDSANADELIQNVETALSFARSQSERNKLAHINTVPKAFRSAKLTSNVGGSLDVFHPAALLQSISLSRKSGILTVTHPEGKVFWCFAEHGQPQKARLGKFTGLNALIEFLVLFESGEFAFTDLPSIKKLTLDEIGKLPKSFDCPTQLDRVLMDGVLARDHYVMACNIIRETGLYVWPQPSARNGEGFELLRSLKEPPTEEEEKVMRKILTISNGKIQLKTIFERLDTEPTSMLWRSAAFLVQYELIQLKKLATGLAI